MNQFRALTISYKTAPLEIREQVAMDDLLVATMLKTGKEVFQLEDMVVLSTCNRTEIYYRSSTDLGQQLIALICSLKGQQKGDITPYFQQYEGKKAVQHLYEVALGLDSMVLGDIQIINQVKRAYQLAADMHMCSAYTHRLLHSVFYTNKRVANETEFKNGNASLASVSVELTKKFVLHKPFPSIAIVGLGEIGSNVACNLRDFAAEVYLFNRTKQKADSLASEYGFRAHPLEQLFPMLPQFDVVISAIESKDPLLRSAHFNRIEKPMLVVDLGVPRNVQSEVAANNVISLLNVDHLNERVQSALAMRKAQIPLVRTLINESIEEFDCWTKEAMVFPVIQQMKASLEEIRKQELRKYLGKLDAQQNQLLENITSSMIQKILKLPALELKAACQRGDSEKLTDVLQELFRLEKTTV